ncbi:hypothetical protein A2U01_0042146 [Trifolium medium]|uniref:Uncharacterized protein n=1 Tax=Trifolium medium TaxID=97028 RepID=A0A392QAS7_9FABA|nr:hypothetical protein [Trifolium medium]
MVAFNAGVRRSWAYGCCVKLTFTCVARDLMDIYIAGSCFCSRNSRERKDILRVSSPTLV